jgi:hypothetical protein
VLGAVTGKHPVGLDLSRLNTTATKLKVWKSGARTLATVGFVHKVDASKPSSTVDITKRGRRIIVRGSVLEMTPADKAFKLYKYGGKTKGMRFVLNDISFPKLLVRSSLQKVAGYTDDEADDLAQQLHAQGLLAHFASKGDSGSFVLAHEGRAKGRVLGMLWGGEFTPVFWNPLEHNAANKRKPPGPHVFDAKLGLYWRGFVDETYVIPIGEVEKTINLAVAKLSSDAFKRFGIVQGEDFEVCVEDVRAKAAKARRT